MSGIAKVIDNLKKSFIITAVITIILGIILVIFPEAVGAVICYVLGGLLLIGGIVLIVKYFSCKSVTSLFSITLIGGIIIAVVGIYIIFKHETVLALVPFLFGILAVLDGLINVQRSILLSKSGLKTWWISLMFSLIAIILGVVMVLNPFSTAIIVFRFIGICLIFNGIMDLFGTASFSKFIKFNDEPPANADYVIKDKDENKKDGENK